MEILAVINVFHLTCVIYVPAVASLRLVSPGAVTDGVTLLPQKPMPLLDVVLKSDDVFSHCSTLPAPLPPSLPFQAIVSPVFL